MAEMLENYGLDFIKENDDTYEGMVKYVCSEGKPILGYSGTPYFFKSCGNTEFWISTERNENGALSVAGVNTHCGGRTVWNTIHSGIDITPSIFPPAEKIIMCTGGDLGASLIPVHILNADVLPGLAESDILAMQVVALPLQINYYENEDEYADSQPSDENDKKWMMGEGSLLPLSFLYNHSLNVYEEGKEYPNDGMVHFRATVSKLLYGDFELNGDCDHTFIRCFAKTQYGEMEFDHTYEQIPEDQRKNLKVGATISGVCYISADVAINEYENGIVRDCKNNLSLIRYTLTSGEAERLYDVLTEDAVYETDSYDDNFCGRENIIERFNYVHKNRKTPYFANFAVITEAPAESKYHEGTKCVALSTKPDSEFESVVFLTQNEDGYITKICVCGNDHYRFRIEAPQSFFDKSFIDKITDSEV